MGIIVKTLNTFHTTAHNTKPPNVHKCRHNVTEPTRGILTMEKAFEDLPPITQLTYIAVERFYPKLLSAADTKTDCFVRPYARLEQSISSFQLQWP